MEENRIKIKVASDSITARANRGRRSGSPWLVVVGGLLIVPLLASGVFWAWPRTYDSPFSAILQSAKPQASTFDESGDESGASEQASAEVAKPIPTDFSFSDDGESLWIAPTEGGPLEIHFLLSGTQLILHIRIAELLAHSEGEKVLAALGPWGEQIVRDLTNSAGVELSEIESLLLGIRPTRGGSLDFALRLHLLKPILVTELGQNCFSPKKSDGKILVMCSPNALVELKGQADEPPLFARELQRVLQRTDATRMATLVFAGKFLQISGEKFVRGTGDPLRLALVDFLGDEATATAFSAHWGENFFLELQSTVALDKRPHRFAALLEERVVAASDQIENVTLAERLHPYGRKVLARFPAMLRKLGNYTRSGEEEGLSVVRSYLPVNAGHNLVMATELLVNTPRSAPVVASAKPQAMGLGLGQTTSLVFPKETLQRALEMLSEDIGVPLEIAGRDLQLEGITKNQSFGIDLRDQPAAEILLAVLLRANPDRTARGPKDVKQKLVYVIRQSIRQSKGDQPSVIVVTTRSAARRRGEKLPAVFQPRTH